MARLLSKRRWLSKPNSGVLESLLFLLLISLPTTSAVTSFCKCTCFTNSTIIRMPEELSPSQASLECNRKFCLNYNLPICKDAVEDMDVSTVCFQRDSVKDEAIVILFIILAGGLLLYALAKLAYAKWQERRQYSQL
ncbi:hypothetical protein POJ06DRAFT_260219 [Lipomyces tetrasporus]|uniref:Uncharacterized protein n=1 Tax=Lipomyces tetrasporus TaxID=54092 RepID=A0AAD7VR57_9ASCO|nr:uncharacterized protein POJ06DRAFT_260219 [Lipomyces tetrasporus]KAJ8097825.1 hypothetical protein POJ06DRAFT_260219 [Lipomyces tetrasporus]